MTQINQNFCDTLHREAAADWQAATRHRFVDEIFAGTLSDAHLRRYLVQDYRFIDRFTALLGAAIAAADRYPARVRLCQFAAMITGDENTYFQRCFDYLGVPAAERAAPALLPVTRQFQELMREAADTSAPWPCCAWPKGCTSTGPTGPIVRCHRAVSTTPSGLPCTPTIISATSSLGCARNSPAPARPPPQRNANRRAPSSCAPPHWNAHFSMRFTKIEAV